MQIIDCSVAALQTENTLRVYSILLVTKQYVRQKLSFCRILCEQ